MKRALATATCALVLLACQDQQAPPPPDRAPFLAIVDGAHGGGNVGFYWLPPLVAAPSHTGLFDGSLAPVVRISDLDAGTLLTEFTMTSGPGSETVRVSAEEEHYIANWHTNQFVLNDRHTYRIHVVVGGTELGHADVDVVNRGGEPKQVNTQEFFALRDGQTLPIKFRIEEGAVPPRLTLVKVVINDNGGTAVAADFTLSASGPTPISGAGGATSGASFQPGTYSLSETGPAGYSANAWSCAGGTQAGAQITLGAGESATCTITNDDIPPTLTLVKHLVNDNAGTAVAADFMLTASGPTPVSGAGGATSGPSFSAGTYMLSETGPADYSASAWSCTGGTQAGSQITLGVGENATCEITNDDIPPGLTLVKVVTNNNGGTAVAADFTLSASGPTPISGAGGATSGPAFSAGTYALSESGPSGYSASAWTCTGGVQSGNLVTLGPGEDATCTIINDDIPPRLTLAKQVVNDNGGTAVATDFTLSASGLTPTPISGAGGATSDATFHQGTYTLSETGSAGYAASAWSCAGGGTQTGSQIALRLAEVATCTIVNDDIPPRLTLAKQVVNDNGGTAVATDFTLSASGLTPTPISGAGGAASDGTFHQGTYTLSETGPAGYAASAWSCTGATLVGGNQIALGLGQSATCTITDDDIAPSLTLVKVVTNDNGGTAAAADFTLSASGPTPTPISGAGGATSDATFHQGTYTLSETGPSGYAAGAWSCVGGTLVGNQITLALGHAATCTIVNNDDIPSGPTVTAVFFGGPGDQRGTGIAISGGALYVSGSTEANGFDGLVARYSLPLADMTSPSWSKTWPSAAGGDEFLGVSASTEGLYLAGSSHARTSDIVGGKENKGIVVKFPLTGPPGGGFEGATWDRQTPAAPGAFGYGGGEGLAAIATAVEGGQPYAYATGSSQAHGGNGGRLYLSKLDAGGSVLWTRTDAGITPFSRGYSVAILNGNIYVAGRNDDDGTMRPYLLKYDFSGNLLWSRRTTTLPGQYLGIAAFGGALYAVGQRSSGSASDFLIEKWDEDGNKLWSQQYDRSAAEDIVYGAVGLGSRLYAAGSTQGGSAGGADACILEIDPATGNTLSTTLFGGAQDDLAQGVASDGTALYVVGDSRSFANGGNAVGQNDVMVLRYVPGS